MQQTDGKNLINLENVLLIEDKLWSILESFRFLQHSSSSPSMQAQDEPGDELVMKTNVQKYADIALLCEEWWEITNDNNINYLDRLFKDDNVRRSVRQAIILQVISITLCYSITSERSTQ